MDTHGLTSVAPLIKQLTPVVPRVAQTSPVPGQTHKPGVPGGAVAGVAIGCLIAGAIIASIMIYWLTRRDPIRRRRQQSAFYRARPRKLAKGQNFNNLLPQPVEDSAIISEVSKIRDNIKNYVQTYYQFSPGKGGVESSHLEGLAADTNISAATFAAILANDGIYQDVLRLFIAWSILSRCGSTKQPTLLPADVASVMGTIIQLRDGSSTNDLSISKWKVLTATLLERRCAKSQKATLFDRGGNEIIDMMDPVLSGFVKAGSDEVKRQRNLKMILTRAGRLAFLLFAQPGTFYFDFTGSEEGDLAIFPALVQLIGDEAEQLNPPRVLCSAEFSTRLPESTEESVAEHSIQPRDICSVEISTQHPESAKENAADP